MVAARSAAMTLNRIADLRFDKENPRTKMRALATALSPFRFAWMFTLAAVALFFVAAWQLNPLALKLAPAAIAILFSIRSRSASPPGRTSSWDLRWGFAGRGLDCHH